MVNIVQQIEDAVWPHDIFHDDDLREIRLGVRYPSESPDVVQIEEDTRDLLNSIFWGFANEYRDANNGSGLA